MLKVKIQCTNIAPLTKLDNEFENKSLKIGVFANNGCGKTFLSRMFRLLEKTNVNDNDGGSQSFNTDKLITLGETKSSFEFKISEDNGNIAEDIRIDLTKNISPSIPNTKYLYHTFNQDFVDENIRALGYEHAEDVQGFILGKTNIDISDDNKRLTELNKNKKDLHDTIETNINSYIEKHIDSIPNIRRLGDYSRYVSVDGFLVNGENNKLDLQKKFKDYVADYDKIKAVPENLSDIGPIPSIQVDDSLLSEILEILSTAYTLSHFADDFKEEMRTKQDFIEKGLAFINETKERCPFCKQKLEVAALSLIDKYNDFIHDEESRTIKHILSLIQHIENKRKELMMLRLKNTEASNQYNVYKTKYIPSCESFSIENVDIKTIDELFVELKDALDSKQKDISLVVKVRDDIAKAIKNQISIVNKVVERNTSLISEINGKKNAIGEENKEVRRNICKAAYNDWVDKYGADQKRYKELSKQIEDLALEIKKKQESVKVSKKKLVADTIKQVLDYFFSGKYSLDDNTFRLVFQSKTLEKEQTKNILSEGEKNIVAFAYYLGDTHTIIEKEDDYKRLFFIIDDPISSMDFTYVYTMSGVIRDLKTMFPKSGERIRHIVLTHNSDFIRILSSNNILDKILLLKNNLLQEWNDNFTVPYINHLLDIYLIARKKVKASHTTANSIRHIIETIDKFESINSNEESVKEFIRAHIPNDKKSYTYINDLSHGGWRTEQQPMTDDDYQEVCETIITLVESRYPNQIKYCREFAK